MGTTAVKFVLILFLFNTPVRMYPMADNKACMEALRHNAKRLRAYGYRMGCIPEVKLEEFIESNRQKHPEVSH